MWNELQTLHPALKTHRDLPFFHFLARPLYHSTLHPLRSSVFLGLPPLGWASRLLQQLCPLPVIPFYSLSMTSSSFSSQLKDLLPGVVLSRSLNLKKPSIYIRGSLNIFVMSFTFVCLCCMGGGYSGSTGGVCFSVFVGCWGFCFILFSLIFFSTPARVWAPFLKLL